MLYRAALCFQACLSIALFLWNIAWLFVCGVTKCLFDVTKFVYDVTKIYPKCYYISVMLPLYFMIFLLNES